MAVKKKILKKVTPIESAESLGIKVTTLNKDYSIKGGHRGDTISVYKDIFEHVSEIPNAVAYGLMRTSLYKTYLIDGLWEGRDNWEHIESELDMRFDEIDRKAILDANIRGVKIEVIAFDIKRLHHIDRALQLQQSIKSLPEDAQDKIQKIINKHNR